MSEMPTRSLAQKMLAVQKRMGVASRSSENPFFKSNYTDLNEVLSVCKPVLNEEGIYISQEYGRDEFGTFMRTSLIDADSCQTHTSKVYNHGAEKNMQEIISSGTYGARSGLKRLLAMEDTDDDGETSVGRGSNTQKQQTSQRPPVAKEIQSGGSRKTTLEKIGLASKVIIDSKRATQDEVYSYLTAYGVKGKEELTDEQAVKLLTQLQEKLG